MKVIRDDVYNRSMCGCQSCSELLTLVKGKSFVNDKRCSPKASDERANIPYQHEQCGCKLRVCEVRANVEKDSAEAQIRFETKTPCENTTID